MGDPRVYRETPVAQTVKNRTKTVQSPHAAGLPYRPGLDKASGKLFSTAHKFLMRIIHAPIAENPSPLPALKRRAKRAAGRPGSRSLR
jgi:hypothetical protein